MIGAKAQPSNTLLPVLQKKKNFELRTGCWVRRVIHRDGKAEALSYIDAAGKQLLSNMYGAGVEIKGCGCMTRAVVEEIMRETGARAVKASKDMAD